MGKIGVYKVGSLGVNVDKNPLDLDDQELRQAQNAYENKLGAEGGLSKRLGLVKVNTTTAAGDVLGGIGVPLPYTGTTSSLMFTFTSSITTTSAIMNSVTSLTVGMWFYWFPSSTAELTEISYITAIDTVTKKVTWSPALSAAPASTDFMVTGPVSRAFIGLNGMNYSAVTGFSGSPDGWAVSPDAFATAHTQLTATAQNNAQSGWALTPGGTGSPGFVRTDQLLFSTTTGWKGRNVLAVPIGACVLNNKLYYAGDRYSFLTSTDFPNLSAPQIRVYDQVTDGRLCVIPPNSELSVTTPFAVLAMIPGTFIASGFVLPCIYASTWDTGATGVDGGTIQGRVLGIHPDTGSFFNVGLSFPVGYTPYSLVQSGNTLWAGTSGGGSVVTPYAGRVYRIRAGETSWTLDKTFTARQDTVQSMIFFQGKLYAALSSDKSGLGSSAVVVRDMDANTWSTSDNGGTAVGGYFSLFVFKDNLYATRASPDTGTEVFKIRKFDGTTWSTVYTQAVDGNEFKAHVLWQSGGTLIASTGGTSNLHIITSTDGTTYTDRTSNITLNGSGGCNSIFGSLVRNQ